MKNIFYFMLGFTLVVTIMVVPYANSSEFVIAVIYNPAVEPASKIALEIKEYDTGKIRYQAVMFNDDQVKNGKLVVWRYKRESIDPPLNIDTPEYKKYLVPTHILMGK